MALTEAAVSFLGLRLRSRAERLSTSLAFRHYRPTVDIQITGHTHSPFWARQTTTHLARGYTCKPNQVIWFCYFALGGLVAVLALVRCAARSSGSPALPVIHTLPDVIDDLVCMQLRSHTKNSTDR